MSLIQNNYRDTFPGARFFGATLSNGSSPYTASPSTKDAGGQRNIFATNAGVSSLSSKPAGARNPVAWQMPQKAGGLASRNNTSVTFSETGNAVLGLPAQGSSTITFTPTGTGGLIVSGSGTATITFDATGSILSIASGSGSSTISFSSTALIGALAGLQGQANITVTPAALISAIGYLAGLSTSETEFSAAALANAVWQALASNYLEPGTMGAALSAAGSAGDPWTTNIPGSYVAGQAGYILGNLVLTEDDLAKIADVILRRSTTNIEGSASGDALSIRSLYGLIAQGVHNTQISGSTLTVTRSDDSTPLATRSLTTSASAQAITGIDTD